jgi:hypothetical protein
MCYFLATRHDLPVRPRGSGHSYAPAEEQAPRPAPRAGVRVEYGSCTPLAANMSAAQMIRCPDFARVVGADQQRGRKFDPERLGRFEVEGQLDSCGLLDRQIGWFLACVSCSTAIHSRAIQRARSTSQCRGNGQISSSTTVRAARGAGSRRTSHLPSRGAGKGLLFTPVRESSGQSLY